jgi:hypothetical protein
MAFLLRITVVFFVNIPAVFLPASLPLHKKNLGVGVVVIGAPAVPMNSQRD